MATVYKMEIKFVSAFIAYDEEYIENLMVKFLSKYRDENSYLGFESIDVKIIN